MCPSLLKLDGEQGACVLAVYPVPKALSPMEQEAAQEDYIKQSHFVQPPPPSRALLPQPQAHSSFPYQGNAATVSTQTGWTGEGGNHNLAPADTVLLPACTSVSHCVCARDQSRAEPREN